MKRPNIALCALGLVILIEAALFVFAHRIGETLGPRLGPVLIRVGKGKIADPSRFISGRIVDAVCLFALAFLLAGLWIFLRRFTLRKIPQKAWIILSMAAFATLNLWIAEAMNTCLFWGFLYTGRATSNFTQYHFKKALLKENAAPRQVILVGSSQTQAQLDENQMNNALGKRIWTTELHYPGSTALDLLLTTRRLAHSPGQDLVCYVSEYYFYTSINPETAPYFLSFNDLFLLQRLGYRNCLTNGNIVRGLLGQAIPLFRCRESLTDRVLGASFSAVGQFNYNSNLETNLIKRADEAKLRFKLNPQSDVQKAAFASFIEEAALQNRRVILLEGQLNPILGNRVDPAIREDMRSFLRRIAAKHPNVRLVTAEKLPSQSQTDYQDLTHVNEAAQTRFTAWFADYLAANP